MGSRDLDERTERERAEHERDEQERRDRERDERERNAHRDLLVRRVREGVAAWDKHLESCGVCRAAMAAAGRPWMWGDTYKHPCVAGVDIAAMVPSSATLEQAGVGLEYLMDDLSGG